MYNLIEYSGNYLKTLMLPLLIVLLVIVLHIKTPAAGNTKHVEIAVPLKHLSNFWRTFEYN